MKFTHQTAARHYLATAFNYRLFILIKHRFVLAAQIEGIFSAIKNYNQNILAVFLSIFYYLFFIRFLSGQIW